jgi:hypothetical protein
VDERLGRLHAAAYQSELSAAANILAGGHTEAKAIELAENARGRLDEWLGSLGDSRKLACRARCSWCCYARVSCSPPEAISVAAYVQSRLIKRVRTQLVGRLSSYRDQLRGLDADAKAALKLACPFLEDGVCLVHKARPLACHSWHSYDAAQCKADWEGLSHEVSTNGARFLLCVAVLAGVNASLTRAGLEGTGTDGLELAAAVQLILDKPDTVAAWLRGEDAFAAARFGPQDHAAAKSTAEFRRVLSAIVERPG